MFLFLRRSPPRSGRLASAALTARLCSSSSSAPAATAVPGWLLDPPPAPELVPPLLAVVGRPNVGKSTLFNRLSRADQRKTALRQPALVSPNAGTTRDRLEYDCEWDGFAFRVQDTGGVVGLEAGERARSRLEGAVEEQVREAVRLAGAVLFMVDGKAGVTGADEELARALRRVDKPVLLAVNKIDSPLRQREDLAEFWGLGLGEPHPLSALGGAGSGDLLSRAVDVLRELPPTHAPPPRAPAAHAHHTYHDADDDDDDAAATTRPHGDMAGEGGAHPDALSSTSALKVAVVGQPNAGKSSLLNFLLGEERLVVDEAPGTTRDPISVPLSWQGERLLVADTAGIRRRAAGGKSREDLDRMAVVRAQQTLEHCHVALLLVDATAGLRKQDLAIAERLVRHGKSCVLVGNKADLLDERGWRAFEEEVQQALPMMHYAPLVRCSAVRGDGVGEAMGHVLEAGRWRRERLHKKTLNTVLQEAQMVRPLPLSKTRGAQKIKHVLQADTEAPTFVLHMNRKVSLHPADVRYLENSIRAQWPFTATPLRLVFEAPPPSARSPERMRAREAEPRWQSVKREREKRARFGTGAPDDAGGSAGAGGGARRQRRAR